MSNDANGKLFAFKETILGIIFNLYSLFKRPGSNKSLAVMVYFFGGGFINGLGNFIANGPHYLIQHDVVIVCINYRVGVFGKLIYFLIHISKAKHSL